MQRTTIAVSLLLSLVVSHVALAQKAPAPPAAVPARAPTPVAAPVAPPATSPATDPKEQAKSHFELGLAHFDREEWDAALAEFLESRKLFPTRSATTDSAIALRKLKRFDEALEMWETLLRDFPNLTPADRALAEKESSELRASVGTLDIQGAEQGATMVIDGRDRGTFPPSAPIRVGAGSHVIRVYKEGFQPFEGRVEVPGQQNIVVQAKLGALLASGRLRVAEQEGRVLDVLVDGVVVGKTPWEGTISIGKHDVVLRGEGDLGTQPAEAPVQLNQLATLTLVAEKLEASARVDPTPTGASVAIDRVTVGQGVWEGKLRAGGHRVEVAADGFLPFSRMLSLAKGQREAMAVTLERDPTSPMWAARNPPHFFLEVDGSFALAPSLDGDVASSCSGSCSRGLGLGARGVFHGGYQLGIGLGFSIDAGYLRVGQAIKDRAASVSPIGGLPADGGKANDTLTLAGLTIGASASFHRGETWPFLLRLGVGMLLGSASDARSGTFTNSEKASFSTSDTQSPTATYLYFAPEARIGRRFGAHFEVTLGVEVAILTALSQPAWSPNGSTPYTSPDPLTNSGDGLGTFPAQSITGGTVIAVLPGLGARYEF